MHFCGGITVNTEKELHRYAQSEHIILQSRKLVDRFTVQRERAVHYCRFDGVLTCTLQADNTEEEEME